MFLYGWFLHTLEALINAALVFAALTFVAQISTEPCFFNSPDKSLIDLV